MPPAPSRPRPPTRWRHRHDRNHQYSPLTAHVGGGRPGNRRRPAGRAAVTPSPRPGTEKRPAAPSRGTATTPYGIRDMKRLITGPPYAQRLVTTARAAGVTVRTTKDMVTGLDSRATTRKSPAPKAGYGQCSAVVLATGGPGAPPDARLIQGDRPAGVFTTGQTKNCPMHHGGARSVPRAVVRRRRNG